MTLHEKGSNLGFFFIIGTDCVLNDDTRRSVTADRSHSFTLGMKNRRIKLASLYLARVLAKVCYSMCVLTWKLYSLMLPYTHSHTYTHTDCPAEWMITLSHSHVASHITEQVHTRQESLFFPPSFSSPDKLSGRSCFYPFYWSTLITFQISYLRHLAEDLIQSTYNESNSRLSFNAWILHNLKNTSHSYKIKASLKIKNCWCLKSFVDI